MFPGGGDFADLVRYFRGKLRLSPEMTHRMALACLDQNAYIISNMSGIKYFTELSRIKSSQHRCVIIAPYRIMTDLYPFSGKNLNIDILSSDSSAIYLAHRLKAEFIIATDVDGVYDKDPKGAGRGAELLPEIDTRHLRKIKGAGPLDVTLPELIDKYCIKTWVVNGRYPSRIADILNCKKNIKATLIHPCKQKQVF